MGIRANSGVASQHSGQLTNTGSLSQASIPSVTASNSTAATQADASGVRLAGLLDRYQGIMRRSANSITVISNNMISFDQQVSRQFGSSSVSYSKE